MFTFQRLQIPESLAQMLGDDQHHREPAERRRIAAHTTLAVGAKPTWCERWVASAWLLTEKHFRRIDGHEHLWASGRRFSAGTTNSAKQEKVA